MGSCFANLRIYIYIFIYLENECQMLHRLRTELRWSGCATFVYCRMPLRVTVEIGDFKVMALVDSGSDYDAIDEDLSVLQIRRENAGFVSRKSIEAQSVKGFGASMRQITEYISVWNCSLAGSSCYEGSTTIKVARRAFSEFKNLGDPLILGMPTIDDLGGLEVTARHVWLAGLWIPRMCAANSGNGSVSSICHASLPAANTNGPVLPASTVITAGGWFPVETHWRAAELSHTLGMLQPYWLELDPDASSNLEVLETCVTPISTSDRIVQMTVFARALEDEVTIHPGHSLCRMRQVEREDVNALRHFRESLVSRQSEQPCQSGLAGPTVSRTAVESIDDPAAEDMPQLVDSDNSDNDCERCDADSATSDD